MLNTLDITQTCISIIQVYIESFIRDITFYFIEIRVHIKFLVIAIYYKKILLVHFIITFNILLNIIRDYVLGTKYCSEQVVNENLISQYHTFQFFVREF